MADKPVPPKPTGQPESGAGAGAGAGADADSAVDGADHPEHDTTESDTNPDPGKANSVTSWFKKSCKEVIVPLVQKKLTELTEPTEPTDGTDSLGKRGLSYTVGPDKVPTVFASDDNLWNGTPQVINYFFIDGNALQHDKVNSVIEEWTWYANVVFHQATEAENSNVRIRFDPDDGSWSYVGRQCGSIPTKDATMNLAWLDQFSALTTNERAVILHEFGHVLGLLHEHQSPAHGGYAVRNVPAAIALYSKTQGWTTQQIYDQVINVYKMSDVSNFSQVDTSSIMHYPQPKELTGLDHDIPYNEKLTDLDKAYMILQYPRSEMHPKAAKQGWTFKKALQVMGTPPDITNSVLNFLESDRSDLSGEINPINIRHTIEQWCRATYKGQDVTGPAASIDPARTIANADSLGKITATVDDGEDLCSTDVLDDSAGSGPGKPAHAVMDEAILWPLPTDGSPTPLETTYTIRARSSPSSPPVSATRDQEKMVRAALDIWSEVAGVKFVSAATGNPVDLIIQFNIAATVTPESSKRSKCKMPSGANKIGRRNKAERKDWDSLDADIEYNGIFPTVAEAQKYKSTRFMGESGSVDGYTLNMRSIIHELGHWLGLRHEYCGLYGYWMRSELGKPDSPKFNKDRASTFWATRYDVGSIMDAIGIRLDDAAMEVLKLKGLQPASVRQLRDKKGNVIHKVNLAVTLSIYDRANIALLYPSTTNLVEPDSTGTTFKLKASEDDASQTVLKTLLTSLKLSPDTNLELIAAPLRAGKWQAARKAYLDILEQQQKQEAESLLAFQKFIASEVTVTATDVQGVYDVALADTTGPGKAHGIQGPGPSIPLHDGGAPAQPAPTAIPSGPGSFVFELYNKLSTMYCPGGGQYFALQFPTRFLDKQSYQYKLDGYFSRFNKPVTVNEAEFTLTDALYPIAPIVGGPNGQMLSKNYSKALNALIPTFESVEVRKQREKMRQWLLKETKSGNAAYTMDTRLAIPGLDEATAKELSETTGMTITAGPSSSGALVDQAAAKQMALQAIQGVQNSRMADPRGMTRMEFSDSLMQAYLNDRKTWELQKDDMIKEASEKASSDPQAMEKLTRRLAHISAIEEAKLASKYADAVVRGYSHTVRGFMGHLDIKTIAESLQDAKDSFRESALSSLYTASTIYPVAMQPTDWFEVLDTGFTREDLSQDPDLIRAAVQAKSQLIDNLENQIANLRGFNRGDPEVAQRAMEAAAAKRETAMANLSQKYTASTVSAIKLAIDVVAATTPAGPAATAASRGLETIQGLDDNNETKKGVMGLLGGDSQVLSDIGKQMDEVAVANAAVNSASRELTEHMSEYAMAVAGDTRTMIDTLQRQLTAAKSDLAELQESYTIARRVQTAEPADPGTLDTVGKLPTGNGGSRWSELHIQSTVSNDYTRSDSSSSSSVSSFSCNFWIGSHANSSSQAEAQNSTKSMASTLSVDVSMRVAYVTVDRAGWFDPSFFEMSKSFMRGSGDDNYTPWATWKDGLTPETAAEAIRNNGADKPDGYLAAFPVGYILVKDCVIKVSASNVDSASFKSHFDKQSESSGGFLCFSHSSASRSSADSSASSTVSAQGGVVVRIPGPQILGYMMQLTAKDQSQKFKETLTDEIFIEDTDDQPNNTTSGSKPTPAHAVGPGLPTGGRQSGVRKYDDDLSTDTPSAKPGSSSGSTPAHGIQGPAPSDAPKPGVGHIVDALRTALDDADVAQWFRSQPDGTKEELLNKLSSMLGQVKKV